MTIFNKPKKFKSAFDSTDSPKTPAINLVEFDCQACGCRQAEYYQIQIRANDEPPTEFWKCNGCGATTRSE